MREGGREGTLFLLDGWSGGEGKEVRATKEEEEEAAASCWCFRRQWNGGNYSIPTYIPLLNIKIRYTTRLS